MYLLTGFIINNYVVGATGIELIPHVNFWKEFPFLVKVTRTVRTQRSKAHNGLGFQLHY